MLKFIQPFENVNELAKKSSRLNQFNLELEVGKANEVLMKESEDKYKQSLNLDISNKDRDKPKPRSRGRHLYNLS